jgi:NAD(P)-dependent dehydrogenase (short-subunit alcohol dehydrogenase family)
MGRAAIITGGDSGIGRAVAIAYAREGADVLISYFNEEQDAQETRQWVEKAGRKAVAVPGDIQDEAHCGRLVERAVEAFGHVDILVNNAAYQMTYEHISEITSEEFERTFRTNVFAMFHLCKAAVQHMRPGSAIINTTSIEAFQPAPVLLPYSATKGAIVTFTESLAAMLIKQGIRVNAVAPGPVWTPLIPYSMPEQQVEQFGKSSPIGRPAQPVELAPVYVLLASPEASYITGMVYGVTGGKPLM